MANLCNEKGNEAHRQPSTPCCFVSSSTLPVRAHMLSPLVLPLCSWILPLFSTNSIQSIHNSMCRVETSLCFFYLHPGILQTHPCLVRMQLKLFPLQTNKNRKAAATELCWFFLCHVRVHVVPSSLWKPNAWISYISTWALHTHWKRNDVFLL